MPAVSQTMQQPTSTSSMFTSAERKEQTIWVEMVNALMRGSGPYKAAFSQLQGNMMLLQGSSPEPFDAAMSILAALPKDLGTRSQVSYHFLSI